MPSCCCPPSLWLVAALALGYGAHLTQAWTYSPLQEKRALIDFQQTASTSSSSDWDNNWDHSTSPCGGSWPGVRCNAAGYVSHLFLSHSGVNGRLFDHFYYFRDLEQIYLDNNAVSEELPSSLGSLSSLSVLDLSFNHFVGTLPQSLGSLTNLQRLVLRGNPELTGSVPAGLLAEQMQHLRIEGDGTQISETVAASGGSSGNSGRAPYKASRYQGSATTYPQQTRRIVGVGESLYHSGL
eukprot:INCI18393.2.p1 GENE.INCI18393.2~~INCI18393.2.p1  ORF type:complete len:239 (+),score=34.58 INCI18393.2:221-937(+)